MKFTFKMPTVTIREFETPEFELPQIGILQVIRGAIDNWDWPQMSKLGSMPNITALVPSLIENPYDRKWKAAAKAAAKSKRK